MGGRSAADLNQTGRFLCHAVETRVRIATVRTYPHAIFAKTGQRPQVDLVRLILSSGIAALGRAIAIAVASARLDEFQRFPTGSFDHHGPSVAEPVQRFQERHTLITQFADPGVNVENAEGDVIL